MHWFEKKGTARIWCPHGRGNAGRLRKVISEDSRYRAVVPVVTMVNSLWREMRLSPLGCVETYPFSLYPLAFMQLSKTCCLLSRPAKGGLTLALVQITVIVARILGVVRSWGLLAQKHCANE